MAERHARPPRAQEGETTRNLEPGRLSFSYEQSELEKLALWERQRACIAARHAASDSFLPPRAERRAEGDGAARCLRTKPELRQRGAAKESVRWPVSRVLYRLRGGDHSSGMGVATHLTRPTRTTMRKTSRAVPIWSCSRWGLPCHLCCQRRGALLPHHFNLAAALGR